MVASPHQVHDPSQDGHGEADVIGRKLLHYEVVARLGAGGMGEVWRAYDPRLEREVAIKVLPSGSGEESPHRERFVREARAASALAHPNIITIHEINTADGLDFIVMEYVRGEPLSQVLSGGALSAVRAIEYTLQVADALKAAHEAGIVHRDLKPSNIMIGSSGSVKVLDFGIAKRVSDGDAGGDRTTSASLTMMGQTIGTPAYMSPEQTVGDIVDARSDLFSLGVVLYEMLSGQRPFQSPTNLGLVRKIVHEPPRALREVAPHVPSALLAIVSVTKPSSAIAVRADRPPRRREQDRCRFGARLGRVSGRRHALPEALPTRSGGPLSERGDTAGRPAPMRGAPARERL